MDLQPGGAPTCVAWSARTGLLACGCVDGGLQVTDRQHTNSFNFTLRSVCTWPFVATGIQVNRRADDWLSVLNHQLSTPAACLSLAVCAVWNDTFGAYPCKHLGSKIPFCRRRLMVSGAGIPWVGTASGRRARRTGHTPGPVCGPAARRRAYMEPGGARGDADMPGMERGRGHANVWRRSWASGCLGRSARQLGEADGQPKVQKFH